MKPETQDQPAAFAAPETEGGSSAMIGSAVCPECGGRIGKRSDGQYWCKDGWPEGNPLEWGCGWSSTVLPNEKDKRP